MTANNIFLTALLIIVLAINFFVFFNEYHKRKTEKIKLQKQTEKMLNDFRYQCEIERQKQKTILITILAFVTIKALQQKQNGKTN